MGRGASDDRPCAKKEIEIAAPLSLFEHRKRSNVSLDLSISKTAEDFHGT